LFEKTVSPLQPSQLGQQYAKEVELPRDKMRREGSDFVFEEVSPKGFVE